MLWQLRHAASLRAWALGLALITTFMLAACGSGSASATTAKGTVSVAYAGSLVNLMEHSIGPGFAKASGYTYQGKGAGSTALANQIKSKLIQPDVFISVSSGAYKLLTGANNGNLVTWHVNFAATSMVIGYSSQSKFAAQLEAAASGTTPWYQVLESPGLRLGRTDPALDPKGINTLLLMQLAEKYYNQPGLSQKILGAPTNAAQIFPEEQLVARLTSGQLDAGFFYLNEVKDAHLPYVTLPTQVNLGDPAQTSYYAGASYTDAKGKTTIGSPIVYSLTIPTNVKNRAGAVAFVQYLLGDNGERMMQADGIVKIPFTLVGDSSKVPGGVPKS